MGIENLSLPPNEISNIVIPEFEKASVMPFDPENLVTENDWERAKSIYTDSLKPRYDLDGRQFFQPGVIAKHLRSLKILFPKESTSLQIHQDQNNLRSIFYQQYSETSSIKDIMYQCLPVREISPETFQSNNKDHQVYTAFREMFENASLGSVYAGFALDWRLAYPILTQNYIPDPKKGEDLLWDTKRQEYNTEMNGGGWSEYFSGMLSLKSLYPELVGQLDLSSERWQLINDKLENVRQRSFKAFLDIAAVIKVFCADSVNITDRGLIPIYNYKGQSLQQSLPIVRNY